jgi:site-specific DNA-methyltransferase (adenine-specific)
MPADSVHCCVTSPPYWGLRDYRLPPQIWGGDPSCEHEWGEPIRTPWANDVRGPNGRKKNLAAGAWKVKETGPFCARCGAWRGSLGLEPDYRLYVDHLFAVMREVRRVLRPDGTLWLNLGDCYATGAGKAKGAGGGAQGKAWQGKGPAGYRGAHAADPKNPGADLAGFQPNRMPQPGLKPKDLAGIPWRVAFALQDDGWWLRRDIVWSKPNPMPESVRDRPTTAHEYLFLLTKSARYWYDGEAIKEPAVTVGDARNRRSVWTVATQPFAGAHFATFPPALIAPCILAGCPAGGTVLDPFLGAGTTALVAGRLGRHCIGIELNPAYAQMARARNGRGPEMALRCTVPRLERRHADGGQG